MKDGSSSREKPGHQVVDKGPVALARGEAGFTLGPWSVVPYGEGDSLVIHAGPDWRICFLATPGESPGAMEMIEANAHLIAASPDLYEALQGIIDWADFALNNRQEFDSHGARNLDGPAFDKAREALSKARGEG